ncbi:hypothetical protein MAR_015026 [Mya arenaria]|uniref:Uncharacterized protein n=1 Tax=Mya arenaria TaxID=6604 RepID=A0ABY7FFY8_MYAAR|nr:hypothetical protein MAR_015026 [Mya arenaria]
MQSWRQLFMSEAEQWSFVLQQNTQVFVMNAVSIDRYKKCDFPWTGSLHSPSQQAQRQGTISKSLTPSFNSAFTNPSSAKSTPQWLPGSRSHQQDSTGFSGPSSPGPDPSQAPDFPIITPSDDSMSPFMNTSSRRPSSDPVNMSNSSMLNGSYLGNVARSFGHYDEKNLLSFAQLRHSSSLPNLSDRDKFHELMPMPVSESEKREASNFNRSRSSLDAVTFDHDDSDTITDKSDSPIGDFSFPPVEEVLSESSSAVATESHPVVAVSDFAGNGSLLRPSPQKGGVVSERVDISAGQGKSAFSVLKQSPKVENQNENVGIPRQETLHRSRYHERHSENSDENQKQEYGGYDSFTNSLTSNISFPNPLQESQEATMATLPISSGAIDVVTILQRVVGFGRVMCQTLMPSQAQYESDQSGNTSLSDQPMLDIFGKQRQKLYENFLKCVRGTVCQFADNMLCMDLCGSTHSMARRLAGSSLVQYLQTQQSSRLIWGCRHDLATSRHCFEYLDRNTRLLCDRHEPITREYGYNPSLDRLEVMETASQLAPSLLSHGEDEHGILVTSPIDGDRDHLMAIIRALCRIMAYRLNLFVMDALPVLLTLKSSEVTIETGLSPLTEFLANYVHTLRSWLYEENFTRVLECLWIFIVQDFEAELRKLEQEDQDGLGHAQLLLQALSHLLKFMNNQHKSLHRDLLLSQADDVSFKLSLYAMPVERLVALYRGLCQDALGSDSSSTSTMYHSVLMVRQRLKHDLQRYKKDFSGADLVKWILKNLELFENLDPGLTEGEVVYKRERAHQIAQRLLDWDIIADVEADTGDQNDSSAYSFDAEFPVVTVHAQLPAKREEGITSDEDNTPEATPRATPKPAGPSGLRQSMRAFSRQSGLKSITPGLRVSQSQRAVGAAELDQSQGKQAVRQTYYAGQRSADKSGLEEAKASTQETLTSRMGKIENTLLTNGANYDDNIAGAGAQNNSNIKTSSDADESSNIVRENTNQDSLVDSIDSLETADARYANNRGMGSPYSYDSTMSVDSNNTIFFDSGSSFYYVKPFVDNFFDIKQHGAWKNNELFSLVEECFQKKVSAQYVMRIIYTRRRNDPRVKKFLQSASSEMIERMSFRARNEEASCIIVIILLTFLLVYNCYYFVNISFSVYIYIVIISLIFLLIMNMETIEELFWDFKKVHLWNALNDMIKASSMNIGSILWSTNKN